jgi:ligand-binding sensor domain-containing protein
LDERFYKEGFNMNLKDIGELPDGRLIVATWGLGLLAEVERGVWKKYGLLEGFESNEVNSILVDKDGYVWVGADKLLRINYIELLKDILSYGKPL